MKNCKDLEVSHFRKYKNTFGDHLVNHAKLEIRYFLLWGVKELKCFLNILLAVKSEPVFYIFLK